MSAGDDPGSGRPPAEPPPMKVPCRTCGRGIDTQDLYCRWCGTRQVATDSFLYHPITILVLALVFIGPFALILVWRAQAMRRDVRIALAAIIIAYSAFTFYFAYAFGMALYSHFSTLLQVM